ncbi:fancd2 isoform X2 [Rhodnius prolixus]|uniref:fancd2 isoform X2 n=1 Tax=Rhodnius prolixus TaxID=13249 RepID=UPI003D18A6A2
MYRKRKKLVTPQASSTLLGNSSTSSLSQISYTESDVSSQKVQSQKDLFDSESISTIVNGNKSQKIQSTTSPLKQKTGDKSAAEKVLEMLSTPPLESCSSKKQNISKLPSSLEPMNTLKTSNDFMLLLKDAGMILCEDGVHNILKKDQAIFVRDLTKLLKNGGENRVNRFIKYLEEYLADKDLFLKSLAPTKTEADCIIARGEYQECLIRLLLMVNVLQSKLAQYLLDRLAGLILSDADQSSNEGVMWVRLILQAMRCLPYTDASITFTKTLFDIIHAVPVTMVQHEIINCIPDLIRDEQRDSVAKELMELMKWKPFLTPSILTAFGNLCLEGNSLYEVKISLVKSLRRGPLDHIPTFVKFILKAPVDGHIDEFLNGIRSELVICHADGPALADYMRAREVTASEVSSTLIKIFEKVKDSILQNQKLADAILKNVTKVKSHTSHKPVDMVMLLLLHSIAMCPSKKKVIVTATRGRIRHGYFKQSLISDTISALAGVLKQNFSDLRKFLSSLLQSADLTVSNFASFFFAECFVQMGKEHRKAIVIEIIDNVKIFTKNARPSLDLLHELTTKHAAKMAPFLTLIMSLLDIVSDLNVFEIRQLMDTICMIAFGNSDELSEEPVSLQNEIYMIVQKQLCCPEPPIFKSGVICSLMTIKHMVQKKENETNITPDTEELQSKEGNSTEETSGINSIVLNNNSEKAYALLELVTAATYSNSEAHELCYDQLSYIVLNSDNMDKAFMKKVSIELQNSLQNNFIIAASEFSSRDDELEASIQFCIDVDLEDPIVLNISDAVIKESKQKTNFSVHKLVALPGLLRVIRGLQLADLSEIDALLGCYISFPNPSVFTKFSTLDQQEQVFTMDCLFHTCNWLREIINSFVYLIKEGAPEKVMMRLRLLLHVQTLVASCFPLAIGYVPPKCVGVRKGLGQLKKKSSANGGVSQRRPRKKKKVHTNYSGSSKNDGNNSAPTQPEDSSTEDEDASVEILTDFSYFQQYLREFDFDVCLILTQSLIMKPDPPIDGKFSAELGPNELLLLLDDLNRKLIYRLKPKGILLKSRETEKVEFNNFLNVPVDLVVRNTAKLISHITNHLQKMVEYFYNLLQENDGVYDALGMFCSGTAEIKKCTSLIFSIFDSFFSWPDLKTDTYIKYLIKAAMKLGGESSNEAKSKSSITLNRALQSAINYLETISKCMVDLNSAVNLVNLINTLNSLQDDVEDKKVTDIGELCNQFLKRKWYDNKGVVLKGQIYMY